MNTFSWFTFGSMSLGRDPADITNDLAVARRALEAGVWFHSSPTYNQGFTFMVLRQAFDEDRTRVPRMVIKVRDASVPLMRFEVEDSCRRLGLDGIDVAQLVSMDPALALRTLGGGPSDERSRAKSTALAELIAAAGCRDATDFNLRLAASEPAIRTTIGGTASLAHLEDYLKAADNPAPLPAGIMQRVERLQVG